MWELGCEWVRWGGWSGWETKEWKTERLRDSKRDMYLLYVWVYGIGTWVGSRSEFVVCGLVVMLVMVVVVVMVVVDVLGSKRAMMSDIMIIISVYIIYIAVQWLLLLLPNKHSTSLLPFPSLLSLWCLKAGDSALLSLVHPLTPTTALSPRCGPSSLSLPSLYSLPPV